MKYVTFGRSDLKVSRVALGTWQFSGVWGAFDASEASDLIRAAYDAWITFIDTAYAYGFGRAARIVGGALAAPFVNQRDEVVIATKGGLRVADDGSRARDSSEATPCAGLEESLRNLGLQHVDVFCIHWPDPTIPASETAGVLDRFVEEGLVRWHGLPNHTVEEMTPFAADPRFAAVQPPYSLLRRGIESQMLPFCERHDLGVMAYGTFAHGLLAGTYRQGQMFEGWRDSSPLFNGEAYAVNATMATALAGLASDLEMSASELATAWTLAHPAVQTAIVGASSVAQLDAIAGAGDIVLSDEQRVAVEAVAAAGVPIGGPSPEGGVPA